MSGPPVAVVDCGSGSSRMSIYSRHSDNLVHEDRYVPSNNLPTLAPAIAAGEHKAWIAKLMDILKDEDPNIRVVVGTTGGLRKALAQGKLQQVQIDTFVQLLSSASHGRAQLMQFSGEQEAEMELKAVRYIAKHALLPMRPTFGGGTQPIEDEVGVLSCGGASSQIAYHTALQGTEREKVKGMPKTQFLSLNTNLLDAIQAAREYGHQTWRGSAFAYTEDLMWQRTSAIGGPIGKLRGTFLVIELAGAIGKEAGLADRLVPKREAIQLLTQHLESMQRVAGKDLKIAMAEEKAKSPQSISFFQEARVPLTIITLALLDLFSSQAWFFFGTSFQVGFASNVLRTQWPLGFFLADEKSAIPAGLTSQQVQSKL